MHQAIVTKYFGPSGTKGTRVRASCQACSLWWNWDHSLNADNNHIAAAYALARKMKWDGGWCVGGAPDNSRVFVLIEDSAFVVEAQKEKGAA